MKGVEMKAIDSHQQKFLNAVAAIVVKQSQKAKHTKVEKLVVAPKRS